MPVDKKFTQFTDAPVPVLTASLVGFDPALSEDDRNTRSTVEEVRLRMITMPINQQSGTTYVLTLADNGAIIFLSNVAAISLEIPKFTTTPLPIGFNCVVVQGSTGQVSVDPEPFDSRFSADSLFKTRTVGSAISIVRTLTTESYLSGDMTA